MASPSNLDVLLHAFMSPDNAVRRQAETVWEDMKQRAPDEVLEKMCNVMSRRNAEHEGLRAMTAVLFRALFGVRSDIWFRVGPQTKLGVKASLLACLTEEPVAHIRRKVTHAVGQLAGVARAEAEWPELMALTVALCSPAQASPELRVVGLDLVNILSEFCHEMLAPHESGLLQTFDACLVDSNIGVRVAALKAACSFVQELIAGSSAQACVALVLKMMSVLEASIHAGEEDAARDALEALNVVAAKQPELLVDGQGLEVVAKAMLALASSPALEISTRELSLELLTSLCENAPDVMRERGALMVRELVTLTIRMLAHKADDDGDKDEELRSWLSMATNASTADTMGQAEGDADDGDEEDELGVISAGALSRVAIALGGSAVLSSALPLCSEFLADQREWRRRKAGLLTLLVIGEGCGEEMASGGLLPQVVLGPVLSGIGDDHPRVRYAALACVGQMAEDFRDWDGGGDGGGQEDGEDMDECGGSFQGTFHAQLLPALVRSLGGPNAGMPRLQAASAGALLTFCNPARMRAEWLYVAAPSGIGADGKAIGAALLEALCELVRSSPSIVVKEEALTAVGCVAQVLGPGFGSFYGALMPLAKEILSTTSPSPDGQKNANAGMTSVSSGDGSTTSKKTDMLRGKAMEAIALMGQAVGIDVFREDAHLMARALLAEQACVSRDPGNPQSTYTLQSLARIAGVLQDEFLPYLDQAIAPLLAALSTDAEVKVSSAPDSAIAKEELEAAGMTAVEMDLRGVGRQLFGVNTSLMQAKESACNTLYQYLDDLRDGLAPHAARTLAVVLPNLGSRNAVAVQVVSAAIVPRLVGMASRRAAQATASGMDGAAAMMAESQAMLESSVDSLCEVVARISGDLGAALEAGGGDMEPACIAVDSLSTILGDHSRIKKSLLTLTAERELCAVRVLREAAIASMRRSQVRDGMADGRGRGRHPLSGMTGAVDAADREEQEQWEEDLMTSAVDGIGWIIKGRGESFVQTFETELKPLVVPLLTSNQLTFPAAAAVPSSHSKPATAPSQMPPSHKSFGLCMAIDVLEYCGESGRNSIFAALLPALLQGCKDEAASTRQACVYGLGVAGEHGGPEFDSQAPAAFQLLVALSQSSDEDDEESLSVADNALSAALRIVFVRAPVLAAYLDAANGGDASPGGVALSREVIASSPAFVSLMSSLLGRLPLTNDVTEGHDCHRRVVTLANALDPVLLGGEKGPMVTPLVTVLAKLMVYQPSPEEQEAMEVGGCCSTGVCRRRETEDDMWSRQLVDKVAREGASQALRLLRERFKPQFEAAWMGLDDEARSMAQTPLSIFWSGCKRR